MIRLYALCFCLGIFVSVRANPIMLHYINEITVDSTDWRVELYNPFGLDQPLILDNHSLRSQSGEARFKSGLKVISIHLVVTPALLQDSLFIDPTGDEIVLYDDNSDQQIDKMSFGVHDLPAPGPGQSLCWGDNYYYLDNSPTLGQFNDTLDATGTIMGQVTDSEGQPLKDVSVMAYPGGTFPPDDGDMTDSEGRFGFHPVATYMEIGFRKQGFENIYQTLFLYPESTVEMNVKLQLESNVKTTPQKHFHIFLSDGFPNPFSHTIRFRYSLSRDDIVDISMINVRGERVENLVYGLKPAGEYEIEWQAQEHAAGVYFCRLQTARTAVVKKCLLVQ
ncbi:hypothetical protein GF406_05535 [candidate division KSB1 bacterium]|nr:hypothetical protein [candidate division KSB1 bacterium]